jgi:diacylglycerol kinase (ATP)
MSGASADRATRAFVIVNPASGSALAADVERALERHFAPGTYELHQAAPGMELAPIVHSALERGVDLVVAGGGDGTVSSVAKGLEGSTTPLGILPLGTANVLARELGIPLDLDGACHLLAIAHATRAVDAMRVGDRIYFTQVGVGIDALMIRDTSSERKRQFGRLAYLWTAFRNLIGFEPRRFSIGVDGRHVRPRASQVVIANCGVLGQPPFRWGPHILPDDGRLDVCIIRARTALDYLKLSLHVVSGQFRSHPNLRYLVAERAVAINADRPLPVQADGEIIGETPVLVHVVPKAVQVVVPRLVDERT